MLLDPERPGRGSTEPSLRLWKSVHDALHDSHRLARDNGSVVGEHLAKVTPPPELGTEESLAFRAVIEHYVEAFGDDDAVLDSRCGEVISRPSSCGRYQLTAMANLMFRRPSAAIEIRRVKLTPRPSGSDRLNVSDVALAALLRSPSETSDVVATVHTLWTAGSATVTSTLIGSRDIEEFRSSLRSRVDQAFATPDEPTPGWWCGTCPFILRCPAIPQDSPETVFSRAGDSAAATTSEQGATVTADLPVRPRSDAQVTWTLDLDGEPTVDPGIDEDW